MAGNVYPLGGGGGTGLTQAQVDARVLALSNDHWGEVPAEANLVGLTAAQRGDTAETADTGDTYRLMGDDPTVLADWVNQTQTHDPFMSNDLFLT